MTEAMFRALTAAAGRPRGNVCPVKGLSSTLRNAAETALIRAMVSRGFVDYNNGSPIITDAGRNAITPLHGSAS